VRMTVSVSQNSSRVIEVFLLSCHTDTGAMPRRHELHS
jgi:hypothetical protein